MHTTSNVQNSAMARARAVAIDRPKTARLTYLDTIRVILVSLVIALHTAITYGASGDWTFRDPATDELAGILLTLVTGMVQAFALGLYFFIAGYFVPGSYDRKGGLRFWKERLLRLALPMVVYTWVLNRVAVYAALVGKGSETRSFGTFFLQTFLTDPDEGPTWFIFALLLFSAGYTLWRLAARWFAPAGLAWVNRLKLPTKPAILGFGLFIAVLMFGIGLKSPVGNTWAAFDIFNLMIIFFAQYILFFIAGVLAYRNNWLARWNGKDRRFWGWLTAALALSMPVMFVVGGGDSDLFMGGAHWQALAFMVWVGLFSVSISMALILWLRDRKRPQSAVMTAAGRDTFGVYLIHPLILIPISVAFRGVPIHPLLKFTIVLPLVLVLCFLAADGLRRIPGLKKIL